MASIIETPSRILRLDLSLNELKALDHAGLKPYKNLRDLNASLNRINKWVLQLFFHSRFEVLKLFGNYIAFSVTIFISKHQTFNLFYLISFYSFTGIEVLRYLYTLNLSHNFIKKIDNLIPSASLVELNLSMNELTDISYMPSMINLEVLTISNNKVRLLHAQYDQSRSPHHQ